MLSASIVFTVIGLWGWALLDLPYEITLASGITAFLLGCGAFISAAAAAEGGW